LRVQENKQGKTEFGDKEDAHIVQLYGKYHAKKENANLNVMPNTH